MGQQKQQPLRLILLVALFQIIKKTRNEERREIVDRRLAEINQEDIYPREEYTEAIQEDIQAEPQYPKNNKPNKLKTYAFGTPKSSTKSLESQSGL